jgi:DNA-binding LytR/AlgR family response regulator
MSGRPELNNSTPRIAPDLLRVLAVDDEAPALDELVWNLRQISEIGEISATTSSLEAISLAEATTFDLAFLDIEMAETDGLALARLLSERPFPPSIIFVTAYERHAVDAFELRATDYVLKPVPTARLRDTVQRVLERRPNTAPGSTTTTAAGDETPRRRIPVEVGGRTIFLERDDVVAVEASRDYVRLHTNERSHLVRVPISVLETEWAPEGFMRVHRSFLVAVDRVTELRTDVSQGSSLRIGELEIPVSRTYVRALRRRLLGDHHGGTVL